VKRKGRSNDKAFASAKVVNIVKLNEKKSVQTHFVNKSKNHFFRGE